MNNVNGYTVKEVANLFAISKRTVYKEIKNGSIKAIKVKGKWCIESISERVFRKEKVSPLLFDKLISPFGPSLIASCSHKYTNGQIALQSLGDNNCRCPICNKVFKILFEKDLDELNNACKVVATALQNIKAMSYSSALNRNVTDALLLVEDLPKIIEPLIQERRDFFDYIIKYGYGKCDPICANNLPAEDPLDLNKGLKKQRH